MAPSFDKGDLKHVWIKRRKKAQAPAAVHETAATAAAVRPADDEALIAVITAAIAACLGTSANGIVVKSIRRTGQHVPVWGAKGRLEQVSNRF